MKIIIVMGLQSTVELVLFPIKVSQQKQLIFFFLRGIFRISRDACRSGAMPFISEASMIITSYKKYSWFSTTQIIVYVMASWIIIKQMVLSGNGLGFGTVKIWGKCCTIQIFG